MVTGIKASGVRSCGLLADETRQALIGATVVCPVLPQFPGTFFVIFCDKRGYKFID